MGRRGNRVPDISKTGKIITTLDIYGKLIPFRLRRKGDRGFDLELAAELPDGTVMTSADINDLKSQVRDRLTGLDKAKWRKMIMVDVDLDSWRSSDRNVSIELNWRIITEAKLPSGHVVHRDTECKSVDVYLKHKLMPWTQQRENVLIELTEQLRGFGNRLHDFLHEKNVHKKLDTVTLRQLVEITP